MTLSIDFSPFRDKQRHSCGKTLALIIAVVSYILTLTLLIGDLFFDSRSNRRLSLSLIFMFIGLVFGRVLHQFHSRTSPLLPPKHWIGPLWMTVYGVQV